MGIQALLAAIWSACCCQHTVLLLHLQGFGTVLLQLLGRMQSVACAGFVSGCSVQNGGGAIVTCSVSHALEGMKGCSKDLLQSAGTSISLSYVNAWLAWTVSSSYTGLLTIGDLSVPGVSMIVRLGQNLYSILTTISLAQNCCSRSKRAFSLSM